MGTYARTSAREAWAESFAELKYGERPITHYMRCQEKLLNFLKKAKHHGRYRWGKFSESERADVARAIKNAKKELPFLFD
jgi:hypothetical protein